jgi:hypothetical protein
MEYFRWMFSDFCHLDRFPADLNDFPGGVGMCFRQVKGGILQNISGLNGIGYDVQGEGFFRK